MRAGAGAGVVHAIERRCPRNQPRDDEASVGEDHDVADAEDRRAATTAQGRPRSQAGRRLPPAGVERATTSGPSAHGAILSMSTPNANQTASSSARCGVDPATCQTRLCDEQTPVTLGRDAVGPVGGSPATRIRRNRALRCGGCGQAPAVHVQACRPPDARGVTTTDSVDLDSRESLALRRGHAASGFGQVPRGVRDEDNTCGRPRGAVGSSSPVSVHSHAREFTLVPRRGSCGTRLRPKIRPRRVDRQRRRDCHAVGDAPPAPMRAAQARQTARRPSIHGLHRTTSPASRARADTQSMHDRDVPVRRAG